MEITYGHRIHSMDDEYVKLARNATVETVLAGSPGSMLVDFFPVCKWRPSLLLWAASSAHLFAVKHIPTWMPGAGFKRNAFKVRDLVRALMDAPYNMVKNAMVPLP